MCCIIKSLVCVIILAAAALCTWRFGPWYGDSGSDSTSTPDALKAQNTCENCCNGLASNCNLPLNQVTFAMAHNAMSSLEDGFIAGYNHLDSLEKAMVAGYRGLMLDSCNCADSVEGEVMNYINGEDTVRVKLLLGMVLERECVHEVWYHTSIQFNHDLIISILPYYTIPLYISRGRPIAFRWDFVMAHVMRGSVIRRR